MHPILRLCNAIPKRTTELTGEFLDSLHEILSETDIIHVKDRDEIYKIVLGPLVELDIIEIVNKTHNLIYFRQGNTSLKVIEHYGNQS